MDLRRYPLDEQNCTLEIESCVYLYFFFIHCILGLVIIWPLLQGIYNFLAIVFNYLKDGRFNPLLCKLCCHERDRDRDSVPHSNLIKRVCLLC